MFPGSQLVYQQALQSFVMSFRMRWDIVTLSLITLQHYSRRLVFQKCASQILLDIFFRLLCFFDFLAQMVEELSQSSKFFRSCSSHTHLLLFFDITFFRLVTLLFCYNPGCQPGINPEKKTTKKRERERSIDIKTKKGKNHFYSNAILLFFLMCTTKDTWFVLS